MCFKQHFIIIPEYQLEVTNLDGINIYNIYKWINKSRSFVHAENLNVFNLQCFDMCCLSDNARHV